MPILDHVTLTVKNYARSRAFYEKALAPLGITRVKEHGQGCGFGKTGSRKPDFWIGEGPASFQNPRHLEAITPTHVAFAAASREEVDAFYAAALEAGGKDFGPPGLRTAYHPKYYGAFILDPDGHDIEAVFHGG